MNAALKSSESTQSAVAASGIGGSAIGAALFGWPGAVVLGIGGVLFDLWIAKQKPSVAKPPSTKEAL